jgi:hypothetical protein
MPDCTESEVTIDEALSWFVPGTNTTVMLRLILRRKSRFSWVEGRSFSRSPCVAAFVGVAIMQLGTS